MSDPNLSSFIWSVADLLRGDYKQSDYGKVILPFTVLRRLDCVLEPTKPAVLAELAKRSQAKLNPEPFLLKKSGQLFYNTSPLDLKKLMGDQDHIGENLRAYLQAFSPAVRDIFESFDFHTQIDRLAKAGLLYLVTEKFATIDLHPDAVSNAQMGAVFEELIRKFAELSNETAGEHFTPREVIRLMVNLLFIEDDQALTKPGVVRSIYDPTAGTGGSRFCELYQGWADTLEPVLRQVHEPGHKLFVDWAGQTVPIHNGRDGSVSAAHLFVAVLGASNKTYVEAFENEQLSPWIRAHCHAWAFFEGVSRVTVPDNLKTGVIVPFRSAVAPLQATAYRCPSKKASPSATSA